MITAEYDEIFESAISSNPPPIGVSCPKYCGIRLKAAVIPDHHYGWSNSAVPTEAPVALKRAVLISRAGNGHRKRTQNGIVRRNRDRSRLCARRLWREAHEHALA